MSRGNDMVYPGENHHTPNNTIQYGLTIREHFAALIMAQLQGQILDKPDEFIEKYRAGRAAHAVTEADALLAELAKPVTL